jgi:hypothetical protein
MSTNINLFSPLNNTGKQWFTIIRASAQPQYWQNVALTQLWP